MPAGPVPTIIASSYLKSSPHGRPSRAWLRWTILVFVAAMITLRQTGLVDTYARYSHLIGGIALLAVGALLILRLDLLAFA
jgi:hypothetical protein